MSSSSRKQTSLDRLTDGVAAVKSGAATPAEAYRAAIVPSGLTPAWFTDRELLELRKVCRDHDGELAERFLKEALKRADRSV